MTRLRSLLVLSLFVALALTALLLMGNEGTRATSFNPSSGATLSDSTPGVASNIVGTYNIPAPDANFGNMGVITFTPGEWGLGNCPTNNPAAANQGCADDAVPNGARAGSLHSETTLGLLNGACNTLLPLDFNLLDATTNMGTTVAFTDENNDGQGDQFEMVGGLPRGVTAYPDYLTRLMRTEPYPGGTPLQPIQRFYTQLEIAGSDTSVQFVIFPPGTMFNGNLLDSSQGFASVSLINNTGDPLADPLGSSINDFCTPLVVNLTTFGMTQDNPDTGANEAGSTNRMNPSDGGYNFVTFSRSQADADDDGIENSLDPCPLEGNASGWNPRIASGPANGDDDSDGIPNDCDGATTPFNNNVDGDTDDDGAAFSNRQDNCPQVPNPGQEDADVDGIGDACDPSPNAVNGHVHEVCNVSEVDVGAGGTPNNNPPAFEPCGPGVTTPTPVGETPSPTPTPVPTSPGETPAPTSPGQTPAPTSPGQTPAPTSPGQTPAPTSPGQTPAPTSPGQTPAPTSPGQTPTPTPTPGGELFGDVNCDGAVNSIDALTILLSISNLPFTIPGGCPGPTNLALADVNCDGVVNSLDALTLLLFVSNLPFTQQPGCATIGV